MNFYITYFYHVRNLPPTYLPISINSGEPAWYHDYKDRSHTFRDKRGVLNGGYIDEISSSNLIMDDPRICYDCGRVKFQGGNCAFMKAYRDKLDKLDFNKVVEKLEKTVKHFECTDMCFLVYEKPEVLCGERPVIVNWFKDHGIGVVEFSGKNTNFWKQRLS